MRTLDLTNFTFKANSQDLQDIYVDGVSQEDIFSLLKIVAAESMIIKRISRRFFLSENVADEQLAEALFRALKSLKENGTSTDLSLSGRHGGGTKKGQYVLLGDLNGFLKTTFTNLCKDRKKFETADKRGGGEVVRFSITNEGFIPDLGSGSTSLSSLVANYTDRDMLYTENSAAIDAKDLYQEFFREMADMELALELADFAYKLVAEESTRKEIIDEMGISYNEFNKLQSQFKKVGAKIAQKMKIA